MIDNNNYSKFDFCSTFHIQHPLTIGETGLVIDVLFLKSIYFFI